MKSNVSHYVLITGASSGIGLGIAKTLGNDAHIILTDLQEEGLIKASKALTDAGISNEHHVLDVTNQNAIETLVNELPFDVDVLINNAGIQHVSRLENFPMDRWQLIVDVLLTAPATLTRATLPGMRKARFGRIINIGSIHGLIASPYKSAYVAAKHGLAGFSKVIALETADTDITINTICPAYVKTPLVEKQIADQAKEHGISEEEVINNIMLEPMPKKAFIDIDEISHTVKFLMAKEARNMTGQSLVLDGGWTVR